MVKSESRSRSRSEHKDTKMKKSRSRSRSRSDSRDRSRSRSRSASHSRSRSGGSARRGRSHSRSPTPATNQRTASRTPDPCPREWVLIPVLPKREGGYAREVMGIQNEDAAFILGKGGKTKHKIARVSNCEVNIRERDLTLEIKGTAKCRERAKLYLNLVMMQRTGPVDIPKQEGRDDLTVLEVPTDCVAFVTGKKGVFLRTIEEEFQTIMFFAQRPSSMQSTSDVEKLAIFGELRGRLGSTLKVKSAVEQKIRGYFTKTMDKDYESDTEGVSCDYYEIPEDDFSYALGRDGSTRRKLARAAGCIMEYVGRIACFVGTKKQRRRCREFLKWLCEQRVRNIKVDTNSRDDVTVVTVPHDCVAFVTGAKGSGLRSVEERTGTFCFIDGDRGSGDERLLIFGENRDDRRRAQELIEDRIDEKRHEGRRGGYGRDRYDDRYDDRRGGYGRDRSRSRDRYDRYDRYDRDRDYDRRDRYDDRRRDDRDRSRSV